MSEVLTAHRLESILRGDQFANVEVLVILAHDAALRAALAAKTKENKQQKYWHGQAVKMFHAAEEKLKKAEEATERLYFAANWHPDRTVDADALWSAIRDAAGITPGQTASRVGPDRGCEQRNAAEARLSEIVKSLAAAVTKEKP
jgi:hypothetical protein